MQKTLRDAWLLAALERDRVVAPSALEALRKDAPEWVAAAVVTRGLAPADQVATVAARAAHVAVADLAAAEPSAVQFVPEAVARQYAALPLGATNRVIRIATSNPLDLDAEQALGFVAGRQVEFQYAPPLTLFARLDEVYRPERSLERLVGGLSPQATVEPAEPAKPAPALGGAEAPAARLVEATIADAVRERASDVLLEPSEQGLVVRYRIDGVLKEVMRVPRNAAGSVVRRLKVLARLDIADPLHAQEGRATARVDGKPWDLQVASAPVARFGEQVSVHLVDPSAPPPRLADLGLWPDEQKLLESLLVHRDGVVLVAGPRDTGKTMALYAALEHIRARGVEVATVEEYVTHHLQGAKQLQVDEKAGVGFGAALRSALRGEPAVILVGEIRDGDTAAAVWKAALGGHLVLSTLRTNDLASALARLQSLGLDGRQVGSALKGLIVQRQLRRLCPQCAEPLDIGLLPQAARPPAAFERPVAVRKAKGCAHCGFSGYQARAVLQEVLTVDGAMAQLIAAGAPSAELAQAGRRHGMRSLWQAGVRRVWTGETSYDELVRVVAEPAGVEAAPALEPEPAPPAKAAPAGPAAPAAAERIVEVPAAPAPAPAAPATPGPLLLVADDDPAMRALMSTILKAQFFEVAEANDGLEALVQAQRLNPAAMLLDMDMPRLDGFGVLEALRRRLAGRSVPVIVVTAKDDPATEARCIELGAEDYLTKPIQPSSLVVRIRAVLRRVGVDTAWPRS